MQKVTLNTFVIEKFRIEHCHYHKKLEKDLCIAEGNVFSMAGH